MSDLTRWKIAATVAALAFLVVAIFLVAETRPWSLAEPPLANSGELHPNDREALRLLRRQAKWSQDMAKLVEDLARRNLDHAERIAALERMLDIERWE